MKRYDYFWARTLVSITSIIFTSQFMLETSGVVERKEGFEYTVQFCAMLFGCSLLYSLILILMNARARSKK